MEANYRKFHYQFAHLGLPKFFFEDGRKLYYSLASDDPTKEVSRLWKTCAERFNLKLKDTLRCEFYKIDRTNELIVIDMPPALDMTEAIYLGLVFTLKQKMFKSTIESRRYFTLEQGGSQKDKRFILCEWKNSKTHINYGELKDDLRRTFIEAVQSMIEDNELGVKFRPTKESFRDQKQLLSTEEITQGKVQEIDVNKIIDDWGCKVPEDLYKQAENTYSNFILQCSTLLEFIQATKRINNKKYEEMRNQIKKDIPAFANICLLLGVDFGSRGLCASEKIHEINDLPVIVLWTLSSLREPFELLNFHLIDIASGHKPNAKEESKKALIHLLDGQLRSFRLGVTYAESINHNNRIDRTSKVEVVATHEEKPKENTNRVGELSISDTIKDLLDVAYHDPDPSVRKQAQEGLRELHPGGPEGFDAMIYELIEGLRDPEKRASSLEILPAHKEMALPMLINYLKDPDPEMRKLVTKIIVEIEKARSRTET